jgi:PAS domain S-box-containing protein
VTSPDEQSAVVRHMEVLTQIINDPAAIIYVRDADGRYVWVSDSYGEQLPHTREQVMGKTNRDLFGDAARNWEAADSLTRASTDFTTTAEDMFDPRPGWKRWRKFVSTKLMARVAGVPYLVGISVEVRDAEAQRYERRLGELRAQLIERMGDLSNGP